MAAQQRMRCLAKAPAERFASAAELREALRGCRPECPWRREEAALWWRTRADQIRRSREDRQDSWSASALSITVEPHDEATLTRRVRRTDADGREGAAVHPRSRA